ncbi:Chromosome partition protein Smc [Posidoniimonas polymericola]|uniref:Chromosome partition protein Smc n=1 Tax=Posidoniimonas polymericola TaxID=2528002 RepID=A0A5C5YL30_9BACT|nr:hypothetical protein [Posidoniimonas polymericola]TWT75620.1 Chromosome partition protein Smc [Posidoniimonas polymericola]
MNFIGKIFVVFILIMSIIFMTLAAVVYATHRDWEKKANTATKQLQDARAEASRQENEYNRLKSELEAQKEASLQQVRKLESERDVLAGRTTNLQREVDDLRGQWTEATAAVASTQKSNNLTTQENQQLRDDIRVALNRTDTAINRALAATDDLHQTQQKLENAAEQRDSLLNQVSDMTGVMEAEGLDPSATLDQVTPRIDGVVTGVARRGSTVLIQVSIGEDDGLRKGHTVEIFRGTRYLGRAEILSTEPDRAIGRIDPRFQEGRIQESDRVATRLNLG